MLYHHFHRPPHDVLSVFEALRGCERARRLAREQDEWEDQILMPYYPVFDTSDPICYWWRTPTLQ
ncbi:hypothetical protein [Paraburkholderia caledonica]|uniref:Uncharacterized protein n=1 Tax=Paraburkholderia caledonica TaxID=134536 RepID=A0AB73INS0_9BURK|nr:hypothetical protein [Paraburkholderia caledonica]